METLIDEVSAAAYDKAVEVVADVVRTETRKEDISLLDRLQKPMVFVQTAAAWFAAHSMQTVIPA